MRVKVAVTLLALIIDTIQEPVPVQLPLHPVKVELASGVAVRVTEAPEIYVEEHEAPQLIAVSAEVTVPLPVPALVTERR